MSAQSPIRPTRRPTRDHPIALWRADAENHHVRPKAHRRRHPARNEARLLPGTIETLPRWIDDIIVVDDGSDDGTADLAIRAGADVSLTVKTGRGPAITSGYRRALELGADIAVVVRADQQMDPTK